jgi:hypothetical protein
MNEYLSCYFFAVSPILNISEQTNSSWSYIVFILYLQVGAIHFLYEDIRW